MFSGTNIVFVLVVVAVGHVSGWKCHLDALAGMIVAVDAIGTGEGRVHSSNLSESHKISTPWFPGDGVPSQRGTPFEHKSSSKFFLTLNLHRHSV